MEAKLKQIEEKLDIIISAMSVHPDFEKYVKEGQMNNEIERKKAEVKEKINAWYNIRNKFISDTISNHSDPCEVRTIGYSAERTYSFAPKYDCPGYAKQIITVASDMDKDSREGKSQLKGADWLFHSLETDPTFCPEFQKYMFNEIGKPLNLDEEIEKLKQSFNK